MADTENEFQNGSLLNKEEQQLVEAFRGIGGGPMHVLPRKNPEVINRPTVLLREVVAEYYHSSVLNKPLVAAFNCPTPDKLDSRKYFCEACTIPVPAREQDWQTHAAGVVHKWQMLSLCMLGELSHQPARVTGQTATRRVAPLWRNLAFDWATSVMRIACAAKKQAKDLAADFQPNEILCLAEILTEQQDIKSISLSGRLSHDYTVHVADAVAVDRLLKALHQQPQLESISIVLTGPTYPDPEDVGPFEDPHAEERAVSEVTAKLFGPAWESLSGLLEHKAMLSLRKVHVELPHPEGSAVDHMQQVMDNARGAHQQRSVAQAVAFAMGTHPRLGADSLLQTIPTQVLEKIVRLAQHPEPYIVYITCSEPVPVYAMEQLD